MTTLLILSIYIISALLLRWYNRYLDRKIAENKKEAKELENELSRFRISVDLVLRSLERIKQNAERT